MKKIVLTGGGTAGHVIPALALLPELKREKISAIFIGGNGIEKDLAVSEGIEFFSTTTVKLDRSNLIKNFAIPYKLIKGVAEATDILRIQKPDMVFSKGGYASLPTCYAAKKMGIPIIVHESDYTMGLANRMVSKFATATLTSFPETAGGTYVGNPVRKGIICGNKFRALKEYPVDTKKKTILIFGGSGGAKVLNEVTYKCLDKLLQSYNVIHISGKSGDFTIRRENYHQLKFSNDMPSLYALADVVVARGGANTLSELAILNKPSVIVPLPKGTSRGDQLDNAESYKKMGYFTILFQENLNENTLFSTISDARPNQNPTATLTNVNEKIVEIILKNIK